MTPRQARSRLRTWVAMRLKRYRLLLPVGVALLAAATAFAIAIRYDRGVSLAAVLTLSGMAYLWGFATRAFRSPRWPPTSQFHRQEYGAVWDTLASSPQAAAQASAGKKYEEDL